MSKIDVTKCIYYNHKMCDASTVCYDGEESKEECEFCKDDCYYIQLQQLKAENEKLSTQNYYLDKANLGLTEENESYLQCLDEIEEKVKKLCKRCALDFKVENSNSIPNEEYCDDAVCYYILQKIKEVKGE